MPGTGAIRWGDISFRIRQRPPTKPPILTRRATHQRPGPIGMEGAGGTGGPGCGARGRWQGLAGLRDDAPSNISDLAPLVWRAPEGPEGTGGLRGAAPNAVRSPSLAGGRAFRRPQHPWGHKQHHHHRLPKTNGRNDTATKPLPLCPCTQSRTCTTVTPFTSTATTSDECGDTLPAGTSTRLKPTAPLRG